MSSRPLGITIIAAVVMLNGLLAVILGANLLGWLDLLDVPVSGDPQLSGWAQLLAGIILLVVGFSLLSLRSWAWWVSILAQGFAALSGLVAIAIHGLDGVATATVVTALISAGVVIYLALNRDAFDA
jgi:hypothetical protein